VKLITSRLITDKVSSTSPSLGTHVLSHELLPNKSKFVMDTSQSASSSSDRSHVLLPESLQHARITSLPQTAYYIPNFISEEEEQMIMDKISSAPKPRWKQLTKRRLQTWPSDLVNNKLIDAPLPAWLQDPVISRLLSLPTRDPEPGHVFSESPHHKPNHVLINEYPPGIGIMPHKLSTRQVMYLLLLYAHPT
jgi:alkylated DNA repair protein alkB family protein 6